MPSIWVASEQLPPAALRTEIPTVVADLCEDACDLAVWRAIRWLIAISGRERLGIDARTVALHAKVDMKTALRCINGDNPASMAKRRPRNRKRGLVDLGLLEVCAHQAVGNLKPRPVYRIPRWIEEKNAFHTRALLGHLGVPSVGQPSPNQVALPLDLEPPDPYVEQNSADNPMSEAATDPHVEQTLAYAAPASVPDPHMEQTDKAEPAVVVPHTDQAQAPVPYVEQEAARPVRTRQSDFALPARFNQPVPYLDQQVRQNSPLVDPNTEHWRDGWKEGGREGAVPPPIPILSQAEPPPAVPLPALFEAHPRWVPGALLSSSADLWRRACVLRRSIDDDQLAVLASEHDTPTHGNGWYWVGRAILAASLSEDIQSLAKVRRTMERWRTEDAYGSDAPTTRRTSPPAYGSHGGRDTRAEAERIPLSVRLGIAPFKDF